MTANRTDQDLQKAFAQLPEQGKHFIRLIQNELLDLRRRVAELERSVNPSS